MVMPKGDCPPTDSRLPERSRQHMVKFAQDHGLSLRQNYNREALRPTQVGRYAHAKQVQAHARCDQDAAHPSGPRSA